MLGCCQPAAEETHATIVHAANVYFGGKVTSRVVITAAGERITLGIMQTGKHRFPTEAAEVMDITAGTCSVKLDGSEETKSYGTGTSFSVPANSAFDIEVTEVMDYICHYMPDKDGAGTPDAPDPAKSYGMATVKHAANVYYGGQVTSRVVFTAQGEKVTLGIILPGKYHFGTEAAEVMDITAGTCSVKLDGSEETKSYGTGTSFSVPANSAFDIEVTEVMDYICHYTAQ